VKFGIDATPDDFVADRLKWVVPEQVESAC